MPETAELTRELVPTEPEPNLEPDVPSVSLGADPELALIGQHGFAVSATTYIEDRDLQARVGVDGAGTPAELRPGVALTPIGLAAKCRSALVEMKTILRPGLQDRQILKVQAGSYARNSVALGGHVHVGGVPDSASMDFTNWADRLALTWYRRVESPAAISRRRSRGYGQDGDCRRQPHGWEYRALGSWLCHPQVAVAAISLVKLAATLSLEGVCYPASGWATTISKLRERDRIPKDCLTGTQIAERLFATGPFDLSGDVFKAWGI